MNNANANLESLMAMADWYADNNKEHAREHLKYTLKHILKERDDMFLEQDNLRKANLHCVDMFNQIKDDYDKVLAENEALKAKLEKEAFMGLFRDINQEIALLKAEQEILKAKSKILIVPNSPNTPPPFRGYI